MTEHTKKSQRAMPEMQPWFQVADSKACADKLRRGNLEVAIRQQMGGAKMRCIWGLRHLMWRGHGVKDVIVSSRGN